MLAVMGYITQEYVRLPGYIAPGEGLKFADVPNGIAAFGAIPFLGWAQLIAFVGFLEYAVFKQDPNKEPGDFGTGQSHYYNCSAISTASIFAQYFS